MATSENGHSIRLFHAIAEAYFNAKGSSQFQKPAIEGALIPPAPYQVVEGGFASDRIVRAPRIEADAAVDRVAIERRCDPVARKFVNYVILG